MTFVVNMESLLYLHDDSKTRTRHETSVDTGVFLLPGWKIKTLLLLASRWRQHTHHHHQVFVFLFPAAKKAKKSQRPLKKQMSSPNFQRKDKAEKVSQRLECLIISPECITVTSLQQFHLLTWWKCLKPTYRCFVFMLFWHTFFYPSKIIQLSWIYIHCWLCFNHFSLIQELSFGDIVLAGVFVLFIWHFLFPLSHSPETTHLSCEYKMSLCRSVLMLSFCENKTTGDSQ